MSLLVSDIATELAITPQICPYDARFYRFLNGAQRQLFLEGNYIGVQATYAFQIFNSLITLPYECEALLQADILNVPVNIQNTWFEFLKSGPGYQGFPRGPNNANGSVTYADFYDRGDSWPVIQDLPVPFTLQIFCAVPEDPNATCIIEGLDENGNTIRTQITIANGDGTFTSQWISGVQSPIFNAAQPFITISQQFSRVTGIQLPTRNSDLRLYAISTQPITDPQTQIVSPAGTSYLLGIYPFFQTNPGFRRYAFPAATAIGSNFRPLPVQAIVRRRVLPVNSPNDRLTINNVEALKMYFQACWKDEEEQWDTADTLRARGKRYLEQEVRKGGSGLDRLQLDFRGFGIFPRCPGSL